MGAVDRVTIVQAGFAAAVVVVGASLAAALRGSIGTRAPSGVATFLGLGAVAAWVAFALDPSRGVAIAAVGLTPAAELERVLARARAESTSLLLEEERRIAETRRKEVADREEEAAARLSEALAETQRRVERRLAGWSEDLERAQQGLAGQIARLAERQKQLLAEVETRMRREAERVEGEAEELRAMVTRLREELVRAAEEAATAASAELESTQSERRRALHELNERLRRRE